MFVPTRTDSDNYAPIDGVATSFNTTVEASRGGFGVQTIAKGQVTFEVLDAMALGRPSVAAAVEAGSAALAATAGGAAAGFTAIDFATYDFLTTTEAAGLAGADSDVGIDDIGGETGASSGGGGGSGPTAGPEATLSSLFTITTASNSGDTVVTITPTDFSPPDTTFTVDDTTNFAVNGGVVTTAQVLSVGSYPFTVTMVISAGTYTGTYTYSWTLVVAS